LRVLTICLGALVGLEGCSPPVDVIFENATDQYVREARIRCRGSEVTLRDVPPEYSRLERLPACGEGSFSIEARLARGRLLTKTCGYTGVVELSGVQDRFIVTGNGTIECR